MPVWPPLRHPRDRTVAGLRGRGWGTPAPTSARMPDFGSVSGPLPRERPPRHAAPIRSFISARRWCRARPRPHEAPRPDCARSRGHSPGLSSSAAAGSGKAHAAPQRTPWADPRKPPRPRSPAAGSLEVTPGLVAEVSGATRSSGHSSPARGRRAAREASTTCRAVSRMAPQGMARTGHQWHIRQQTGARSRASRVTPPKIHSRSRL